MGHISSLEAEKQRSFWMGMYGITVASITIIIVLLIMRSCHIESIKAGHDTGLIPKHYKK